MEIPAKVSVFNRTLEVKGKAATLVAIRGLDLFLRADDRDGAVLCDADLAVLAAAYAFGFAKNHGFLDGNKRTAFQAMYLLLGLNGFVR